MNKIHEMIEFLEQVGHLRDCAVKCTCGIQNVIDELKKQGKEMITVVKTCYVCGGKSVIEISEEQFDRWWNKKELIQNVFPEMSPAEREVLISGTHPDCWEVMFGRNGGE